MVEIADVRHSSGLVGRVVARLLAVAIAIGAAIAVFPAIAREPAPLVIVLDGSGSMWGKLKGSATHKLDLVRQGIIGALRKNGAGTPVGLVSFGARANGSCSASETLLEPAPDQVDALDDLMDKFNPQGRGPVVLGLRTAVDFVKDLSGPARFLLIHDSPDNCGQDLCAFAKDLAQSRPNVTVDVLTLGPKPADIGAMTCLPKATGGQLIEAGDADAALSGIAKLVATSLRSAPLRAGSGQLARLQQPRRQPGVTKPSGTPAKPAARSVGIVFLARLAKSNVLVPRGVSWRIRTAKPASGEKLQTSYDRTFDGSQIDTDLKPGRYNVVLRTANASFARTVTVGSGRQTETFVLEGGLLDISVDDRRPGNSLDPTAVASVLPIDPSGPSSAAAWSGPAHKALGLLLKPGRYLVTVGNGIDQQSKPVEVVPGAAVTAQFQAKSAKLFVSAEGLRPEQLAAASISIAVDDPKSPGRRRMIAETSAPTANFELTPGPYHVTLSAFGTRATKLVVLAPGQTAKLGLRLEQMAVTVASYVGPAKSPVKDTIRYRLWRSGQLQEPLQVRREIQPVFHLAPGNYRIESRIGRQNAVMIREFDVGPSGTGQLELRHDAGRVAFSFPASAPRVRQNAYWEIFDQNSRLIWRTFDSSPVLVLAVGTYSAVATIKKARFSAKFAIVSGQTQTVRLNKH